MARCNEFSLDFFGGKEPFKGKNVFDADSLRTIRSYIGGDNSMKTAFMTTAKLRNAIGHNLVRDDIFSSSDGYVALFDQVMNAIFYVMLKVT